MFRPELVRRSLEKRCEIADDPDVRVCGTIRVMTSLEFFRSSMTAENRLSAPKRRTRAEVQKLVAEFMSSGMRRSEFCESRGLSFSTLDRHLKKRRWKRRLRPVSSAGGLVPVELATKKSPMQHEASCGLAVVLSGGRRIEVCPDFDTNTFERLVSTLERV